MGRRRKDQQTIDSVLMHHKGRLVEVTHDLHGIAERIREIEPEYFIVRNRMKGTWEVHSTATYPNTYCFTVPYDSLDKRTLDRCRETNISLRGDAVAKDFLARQEKQEKAIQKRENDLLNNISIDAYDRVKFGINEDTLHEGYTSTHVMKGV